MVIECLFVFNWEVGGGVSVDWVDGISFFLCFVFFLSVLVFIFVGSRYLPFSCLFVEFRAMWSFCLIFWLVLSARLHLWRDGTTAKDCQSIGFHSDP